MWCRCATVPTCHCFNHSPSFAENLTTVFGEKLRDQVEERLKFYETGDVPRKNIEVMSKALVEHNSILSSREKKGAKKRKLEEVNGELFVCIKFCP